MTNSNNEKPKLKNLMSQEETEELLKGLSNGSINIEDMLVDYFVGGGEFEQQENGSLLIKSETIDPFQTS